MARTLTILPSANEAWGFYGTMAHDGDPVRAWRTASGRLRATFHVSPEACRDFLDSARGRHFADDVCSEIVNGRCLDAAVSQAIYKWQGWRISAIESATTGIPAGMPMLSGYLHHFEIMAGG